MGHHKTESGVSLIGGALLGAAVMYLLDPQNGQRRREHIKSKAEETFDSASDRARDLAATLSHRAGDLSSHLADSARSASAGLAAGLSDQAEHAKASAQSGYEGARGGIDQVGRRVSGYGHDLLDWVRHLGQSAAEQGRGAGDAASGWAKAQSNAASSWLDSISDSAKSQSHGARHAAAKALDPDHVRGPGHAIGYSAAGVGTLVIGAAAMYFLDPERGADRRSSVSEQCNDVLQKTGDAFRHAGRTLAERWHGIASSSSDAIHSAAQRVRGTGGGISGEDLVSRVRAEVGQVLSRPTDVQLMADADGRVTIYGRVPASEVGQLISTVNGVRGVAQVINRVEVRDVTNEPAGNINEASSLNL